MSALIRKHLLCAGVRNLHEYGYPHCTVSNILTDKIYSSFFKSMLESNKGYGVAADAEIDKLLADITRETGAAR